MTTLVPILPTIPEDKKAEEEIRKSLINLVQQMNRTLKEIDDRLKALE